MGRGELLRSLVLFSAKLDPQIDPSSVAASDALESSGLCSEVTETREDRGLSFRPFGSSSSDSCIEELFLFFSISSCWLCFDEVHRRCRCRIAIIMYSS